MVYGSYSFGSIGYASERQQEKNIATQETEDSVSVGDTNIAKSLTKGLFDSMSLDETINKNLNKILRDSINFLDNIFQRIRLVAGYIKGRVAKISKNFLSGKIRR